MEPSTPQGPGPANAAAPRRVYTAPAYAIKQQQQAAASSPASDVTVDTLYEHPSVKIVAFSAGSGTSIGPRADLRDTELGTLSWSSQLERTIAVGELPPLLPLPCFASANMCALSRPLSNLSRPRVGSLP